MNGPVEFSRLRIAQRDTITQALSQGEGGALDMAGEYQILLRAALGQLHIVTRERDQARAELYSLRAERRPSQLRRAA